MKDSKQNAAKQTFGKENIGLAASTNIGFFIKCQSEVVQFL